MCRLCKSVGPLYRVFFVFMPIGAAEALFSDCPSVRACVRPSCVLLARYLTNQWMKFHQTMVSGVVEGTDKLTRL